MNRTLIRLLVVFVACFSSSSQGQSMPTQSTVDDTIKMYCAAWSEPNMQRRLELLDKVWATNGTYTDPTAHVEGRKALADHIGGFMQRTPGAKIVATSHVDLHHSVFRFNWKFLSADGKTMTEGIDFGTLDASGKIQTIVGFFGATKAL